MGLLAAATIGGSIPVSGLLVDFPLLTGQTVRYAVATVLLFAWMRARRVPIGRPSRADLPGLIGVVAVGMIGFNACMIAAQRHADPGLVAVVLGASPLVLALAGPLLARTTPARRTVVGAGVVVGGVAVLSGGGAWNSTGFVLAVLTLLCEVGFKIGRAHV